MKDPKAESSASQQDSTVVKDTDGTSSHTAIAIDSDSDASSAITLVDIFQDLAAIESDPPDDTSAESTDATSSQISSGADEPSTNADGEPHLKKKLLDVECLKVKRQQKKGKAAESESESAESSAAENTSDKELTSEGASSEASSSKAAMAETTTSGDTSSNEDSTNDGTSSSADVSSSAQSSNPGNWTPSEDALIICMKEGGETWASIGNAISRGKNEVKKRWHVVKVNNANSAESGDDANIETEEKTPETKAQKKYEKGKEGQTTEFIEAETKTPKQKEAKTNSTIECTKAKAKKPKQKTHQKAVAEEPATDKSLSEEEDDANSSSSYRERINLLRDTESDSSSSATSGDDVDKPGYYERELARQERYMRHHVHPALYPATTTLAPPPRVRAPSPADKRQRRDDKILAAVASRREATKWLEMQANFFNVTGRMVPLYAIKARCEAEEDRGRAAGVRSWASSVAGSEELLDPSERPEIPEDALINDED